MSPDENVRGNRLLSCLPEVDWCRWAPRLEQVRLEGGQVLNEPGRSPSHAYFPVDAVVSMLCVMSSGAMAEVAMVGNEGMVGIPLCLGDGITFIRAMVQRPGMAYRLGAESLREACDCAGPVLHLLLRYAQVLIVQMAQTAACNRHHYVDQQLCRSLLHGLDRIAGSELLLTQEQIANLLGVRREAVAESAHKLQAAGLIRYARGHIEVLDRAGLERRSCECYAAVRREVDRLLPVDVAR